MPPTIYTWKFNGSTTGPAPPGGGDVHVGGDNKYEINGEFSAEAPHDFRVEIKSSSGTYTPSIPEDNRSDSNYLRGTFVYAQTLDHGLINLLGVTTTVTVIDTIDNTSSLPYTQECSIIVGVKVIPPDSKSTKG